jgi:8-oxo-dGTP pyrophosphatase MutT (NUDIX family)
MTLLTPRLRKLRQVLAAENRSSSNDQVEATVGVLLLDEPGSGLETLLIQRTQRHDDPWSGQIGLPGGRVKKSDPSTRDALYREVLEEVGINLRQNGEEIGPLSLGHPMRRTEMRVQPWVYGLKQRWLISMGSEVSDTFWVSLPQLPSKKTTAQIEIRGEVRSVESFLVNDRIVWGFTHRVLTELLQVPGVLDIV